MFNLQNVLLFLMLLFGLLLVFKKVFPGVYKQKIDPLFEIVNPVVKLTDTVVDQLLLVFPSNKALNTLNDFIDETIKQIEKLGYNLNDKEKEIVKTEIQAKLKQEIDKPNGFQATWEDGEIKFDYNKQF
jgi:hypothetical protein